jgi:conjugal transfer mating pair stabilization protein TraN
MLRIFLCLLSFQTFAQNASALKQEAMKNFQQFNPANAIPYYNPHPTEESIHPENQNDTFLKSLGHNHLSKDDEARFIYENEAHRIKVAENEKDTLLKNAEQIIEHAEENIYQQCHDEPVPCDEKKTEHTCHQTAVYKPFYCEKNLKVILQKKQYPLLRRMIKPNLLIGLTECLKTRSEYNCNPSRLITLSSQCQHLKFQLRSISGKEIELLKYPSCQDPTFIFKSIDGSKGQRVLELDVTELWEEEIWTNVKCDFLQQYFCTAKASEYCVEGPATRVVDGMSINRACWKKRHDFDCSIGFETDCESLIDKGCANISAICLSPREEGRCDKIERTYQCIQKTCYPDKRVCTKTLPCVDGSCDQTKSEESNDILEGISRLGAVAGSAEEISNQQSISGNIELFKGERKACSELPLGLRDCCVGDGFLEGVFHCPADLRELQKAKLENRAVLVGTYKEDLNFKKIYVYCVFPTKLAGILQIQGRLGQLGIGFGEPKNPLCDSGFKASLLERIDFKRLDLSSIVNDFKAKAQFKSLEEVESDAKNHIQDLHDKGRSHD